MPSLTQVGRRSPGQMAARRSRTTSEETTRRPSSSESPPAGGGRSGITLADLEPYVGHQVIIERTDGVRLEGRLSILKGDQVVLRHSAMVLGDRVSMSESIALSEIAAIHLK